MSARAHYTVIASHFDADGLRIQDTSFSHYCTLDEIGRRSVAREVQSRFPGARSIHVTLDKSVSHLVAEVAS